MPRSIWKFVKMGCPGWGSMWLCCGRCSEVWCVVRRGCIRAGKKNRACGHRLCILLACFHIAVTTLPAGEGRYDIWPCRFLRGNRAMMMPLMSSRGGGGAERSERTSSPECRTHQTAREPRQEISIGRKVAWNPIPMTAEIITSSHLGEEPHARKILTTWAWTSPGACISREMMFLLMESSNMDTALSRSSDTIPGCTSARCVFSMVFADGTTVFPRLRSAKNTR